MAIKQNNKTQSQIRFNLSNILGLSEEQAKIVAQNQNRIYGGYNAVLYNANGEPCGCGNGGSGGGGGSGSGGGSGDDGGSGGGGGSGGSGGGGGVIMPCEECVTLAEAAEMMAAGDIPCCIKDAKDCDTGENLPICLSDNCGDGYGKGCTPPPPPNENCSTVVITYTEYTGFSTPSKTVYLLSTLDSAAGDAAAALNKSVQSLISICGNGEVVTEGTQNPKKNCNGKEYKISYKHYRIVNTEKCSNRGGYCDIIINPTQGQYDLGLQNWTKTKGKYLIGGKFYDSCGIDPQDCITACDENGDKYKICANNGKPKITPID